MSQAKYYIYRNLHKNMWSVRYKSKIIGHYDFLTIDNPKFVVSEKGRQRVLKERRKNVHAYIVCDSFKHELQVLDVYNTPKISYNPYTCDYFYWKYSTGSDGLPIRVSKPVKRLILIGGVVYARR